MWAIGLMQDELRNGNRFRLFDVRARASSRGSWDGGRPIAAGSKGDPFAGTNHQVARAPVNDPHDMGMVQSKYDTDSRRAVKKFAHTPALSPPSCAGCHPTDYPWQCRPIATNSGHHFHVAGVESATTMHQRLTIWKSFPFLLASNGCLNGHMSILPRR